jgi:hypothetical protein
MINKKLTLLFLGRLFRHYLPECFSLFVKEFIHSLLINTKHQCLSALPFTFTKMSLRISIL